MWLPPNQQQGGGMFGQMGRSPSMGGGGMQKPMMPPKPMMPQGGGLGPSPNAMGGMMGGMQKPQPLPGMDMGPGGMTGKPMQPLEQQPPPNMPPQGPAPDMKMGGIGPSMGGWEQMMQQLGQPRQLGQPKPGVSGPYGRM